MISASHFASEDVKNKLDELNMRWEELLQKSAWKQARIREAIEVRKI